MPGKVAGWMPMTDASVLSVACAWIPWTVDPSAGPEMQCWDERGGEQQAGAEKGIGQKPEGREASSPLPGRLCALACCRSERAAVHVAKPLVALCLPSSDERHA